MLKSITSRAAIVAASATLFLTACSSSGPGGDAFADEDSIMRFVPSDTPYLLATGSQLPDDLLDQLEPKIEDMMSAYRVLIRAGIEDAGADADTPMSDEQAEWLGAILDELTTLVTVEGLRDAGFERDSRMAFFGHGLLPVLRIELSDAQKFEDMIARIEDTAGESMMVGEVDGQSYRYAGSEAGKFVIGTFDDNAVVTFLPAMMGDDELRLLVGLTPPEESIAETAKLGDLMEKYGYTDHYIGLIDVVELASVFLDEPTGLNAPLLQVMDFDNSGLSDICREEIRDAAAVAPRMVFGYNEISRDQMNGSFVIELRSDIADGLTAIAAAVPGLGTDPGGLLSMGMSGDYGATREFIEARIDAIEADPYECEFFAEMQSGLEALKFGLNQPQLPIMYSFRGFNMVIDDVEGLDLTADEPPSPDSVHASLLVAMEDAQAMVAMGAMFSPELASLDLEPNGDPILLDLPQISSLGIEVYAAMEDDAIAISIGDDAESRVTEVLTADAADAPPVFSLAMDAGTYYELIAQSMMVEQDDDMPVAAREAVRDVMLAVGAIYDRMTVDVRFTENGVEVATGVTLAL